MMKTMGYGYEHDYTQNNIMKDLKDGFSAKCDLYFSGIVAHKLGRRDKHELKERINFKFEINPVLKMFKRLS